MGKSDLKWVLITGGTSPLGSYLSKVLASSGYGVIIHYHSQNEKAKKLVEEIEKTGGSCLSLKADLSNYDKITDFIEEYKKLSLTTYGVINNIGLYKKESVMDCDVLEGMTLFHLNFYLPLLLSQFFVNSLNKQTGRIINIGMVGIGSLQAHSASFLYNASKTALLNLTKSMAKEVADKKITVNMVSPGYLEESIEFPPVFKMGRPVSFEEITALILFLLSSKGDMITGQNIEIAGGEKL